MKKRVNVFGVVVAILLSLWAISMLYLLSWGLLASVKDHLFDFRINKLGLPKKWKFSNYTYVFQQFKVPVEGDSVGMFQQIVNTLIYCCSTALVATFVPCTVGYLVAKYHYKFSGIFYTVALVAMSLPIIGQYPSELSLLRNLNIYDTYFTIIFQRSGYLGVYFFVFIAMFKQVPNDFYDAASLDGASDFAIFFKIMIPMVFSTFSTIFLLIFVACWNDYQYPLMYMPSKPTLSYGLYTLTTSSLQGLSNVPMRMAGCGLVMFPILVIFLIFKDKLMGNVSMGGLKE